LNKVGEHYEVIGGNRRVANAIALEQETILALVEDDIPAKDAALRILASNSGTPNYMDEASMVHKCISELGISFQALSEATGLAIPTLKGRQKLAVELILPFQKLLREGAITYHTGYQLTRLPEKEQMYLLERYEGQDEGKKTLSIKDVQDHIRTYQVKVSQRQPTLPFDMPLVKPGLFLDGETMQNLLEGKTIKIDYDGEEITLRRGLGQYSKAVEQTTDQFIELYAPPTTENS
jgi:ParB-like chromosome segregation protein Spo0J